MRHALGKDFEPDLRDLTAGELNVLYHRLNREGFLCLDAALMDLANRAWWEGRAAGLLDAMMILDNSWPGLDKGGRGDSDE